MVGEALDVKLVDHRFGEGPLKRPVAFPIVATGIGDHAFHRLGRVVAATGSRSAAVLGGDGHGESIRVEQHLFAVEQEATLGRERPARSVGVDLTRAEPGNEDVPVVIRAVRPSIERDHGVRSGSELVVEQQELDRARAPRKDAEVDAAGKDGRSERSAAALHRAARDHTSLAAALGLTCQMSRQYWRIERSEENRPTRAVLRIDMRVQLVWSRYTSLTRPWQST